jgi:alpha-galactosidase/6-phospho-beta-glucosidase family protein
MLKPLDQKEFIFYKDQPNTKSIFGIKLDRIVEIPMFVTEEQAKAMIKYFESNAHFMHAYIHACIHTYIHTYR